MATELGVNDILGVRLEYEGPGGVAYNILHYRVTSIMDTVSGLPVAVAPPVEDILPGIADDIFTVMAAAWAPGASAEVSMTGCTVQDIYPPFRSRPFTHTPMAPVDGANGSDALPLQDAPTILKKTRFGQRWGTGRLFYVGLGEDFQGGGKVVGGGIAALNAFAAVLDNSIVSPVGDITVTMEPVLVAWHEVMDEIVPSRVNPIVLAELSNATIKTQRRRRPGKGI